MSLIHPDYDSDRRYCARCDERVMLLSVDDRNAFLRSVGLRSAPVGE